MWYRLIIGTVALFLIASVQATTLKLSANINLLVLDGYKISGSILKGADGLELEHGEHQILFRVEKSFTVHPGRQILWHSSWQIANFNAQSQSVTIRLPPLTTRQEAHRFEHDPIIQLVNEHGQPIASRQDRLLLRESDDPQQAVRHYNLSGQIASVPRFAHPPQPVSLMSPVRQSSRPKQTEKLLQLWFHQVNSATRQRL